MQNKLNYPREIYLLHNALSNGNNQIIRDYRELELLQSNKILPFRFASKLKEIIEKKIIGPIEKSFPKHGIIVNNNIIKKQDSNHYIIINLLEGEQNLARSLPFFTCNAAISKIINLEKNIVETTAAIAINPILDLFYWATLLNNACEKKQRIRPSNTRELKTAYGVDYRNSNNMNLNSITLELCFLASGKLDFLIREFQNYSDILAVNHIATTAGIKYHIDSKTKIITAAATEDLLKKILSNK